MVLGTSAHAHTKAHLGSAALSGEMPVWCRPLLA